MAPMQEAARIDHRGICHRDTGGDWFLRGSSISFVSSENIQIQLLGHEEERYLPCTVSPLSHTSIFVSCKATVLQDESTRPRLPRRQGERACRRSACMGALRCSSGGLPHCGICYRPPTPRVGPKARLIRVRALCDQAAEVGAPLFGAVRSDSRGWFQCARGCSAGSLSDSWFHNSTPTIRAPDRA